MKLTRIKRLNHRVFRNFIWPKQLLEFSKFNLIYGWNGCGKTTLSSLLTLVEKRTDLTEGDILLEFDSSSTIEGTALSMSLPPQVRVFNRDYVNATLSQTGDIEPIYYIGKESSEKQARVAGLKIELKTATDAVVAARKTLDQAEEALDTFCFDHGRLMKELLTTANNLKYSNYDKRKFKQKVQSLANQDRTLLILTDDQKQRLRSQKDDQTKPVIEEIDVSPVDFEGLAKEVDSLVNRSVIAQTLEVLVTNPQLAQWVQAGLALHTGEADSRQCLFCTNPLERSRRSALEAHFNDAYQTFLQELGKLQERLEQVKKNVYSAVLPDVTRFYNVLAQEVESAIVEVKAAQEEARSVIEQLLTQLERKRDRPFAPLDEPVAKMNISVALVGSLSLFNASVRRHNQISQEFEASVENACKTLEQSYVAEAYADYVRLSDAVVTAQGELELASKASSAIETRIVELERTLLEHRLPAEELTNELRAYLGRDELRFELEGTGYALRRDGYPVRHLSEGERTAIALLYFLKSLRDRTFDLPNGIVVIDDPVSSLDANGLFSAFGFLKDRTRESGQLFILTHNFAFFRNVKNWFTHINGGPRSQKPIEKRDARFYMLSARQQEDGSRSSALMELDPLLSKYESEYQYLFKCVYDEAHRKDVVPLEHHYGLPNIARRLLEAFLAFRFPDLSGDFRPRLDRVVERKSFDQAKCTRILRLLNTYSHGEALTEEEHDLTALAETRPVLLEVLELMQVTDREHYEALRAMVETSKVTI